MADTSLVLTRVRWPGGQITQRVRVFVERHSSLFKVPLQKRVRFVPLGSNFYRNCTIIQFITTKPTL